LGELMEVFPRPPLRNPTLVCASKTKWAVIPAQEVTLRDRTAPSDPATHSVEAKAFTILLRLLLPSFVAQNLPLIQSHLSNVSRGMNIAVRSIPENGQKPIPCALFPLETLAKLNDVILKSVQLRISGANDSDVGELGYSCTAGQNQGPFLLSCSASSTTEGISL